jgi:hypothetical protein
MSEGCFGVVGMQTDDTLILGTESLSTLEEEQLKKANFQAKTKADTLIGYATQLQCDRERDLSIDLWHTLLAHPIPEMRNYTVRLPAYIKENSDDPYYPDAIEKYFARPGAYENTKSRRNESRTTTGS